MLQRAASNAYSWWWASHIRTKQSKWLEQSLQDMGEKVEAVMKLIQEDGDSFAKRAEMYYKKRPELINFVEESYRAYQSLAERYDHISKELQNANSTLASAFPDQFQYQVDDDDDYTSPRVPRRFHEKSQNPNIPKAPTKFPAKNIKAFMALTAKSKNPSKNIGSKSSGNAHKSGLTKSEALNEIDKLQKNILTLQTEKEFAKSSYDRGYAKYWEIEEEITRMQEKISKLQDEFGIAQVIEDEEARTLMAEAALKSCQQTLAQLQEKQEKAAAEAKTEQKKIRDARDKLKSFKGEFCKVEENWMSFDDGGDGLKELKDMEMIRDKIKEHFDVGPMTSLTVSEMAEKIDELVNKVIDLETAVSSQDAMIHRLRSETDELQSHISSLEDDKANLIDGKNTLSDKLMEMENKLKGIQDLNRSFENQNSSLETHFTEARSNLDTISEKLHNAKPDEEVQESSESQESGGFTTMVDVKKEGVQKGNDISTLILSRDGEGQGKPAQLESNALAPKKDDTQMQEQPIQEESELINPVVAQQPQAHSNKKEEESELITPVVAQPQANSNIKEEESKLITPVVAQPQAHSNKKQEESEPITPVVAQPQAHSNLNEEESEESKINPPVVAQPQEHSNKKEEESKLINPVVVKPQAHSNKKEKESGKTHETQQQEPVSLVRDDPGPPQEAQPDAIPASSIQPREQTSKKEDEPDWQQLFMNGLEGKEKVLLAEYTSILRNYKEAKKKLSEIEKKTQDNSLDISAQLKDLKSSNASKDEEIRSLHQKLGILQKRLDECWNSRNEEPSLPPDDDDDDDIKIIAPGEGREISPLEEKLRADIDEILEENLDFWMRFSASFGQIQKFQNGVQDLHSELQKLERETEKKEGGSSHGSSGHESPHMNPSLISDVKPLYKHLREIQTELTVWLEQSEKLKDELQSRFSQLCDIQEEIKRALNAGAEDDDMKFTSFQAAKFQGEVANMQQENHKVADELQAGMDHITSLQLEVDRTITRLNDELGFSGSKSQNENQMRSGSRGRVPLRSFIFGVKPQKKKQSIFSCMHPAMMHRRYQNLKSDKSL